MLRKAAIAVAFTITPKAHRGAVGRFTSGAPHVPWNTLSGLDVDHGRLFVEPMTAVLQLFLDIYASWATWAQLI